MEVSCTKHRVPVSSMKGSVGACKGHRLLEVGNRGLKGDL